MKIITVSGFPASGKTSIIKQLVSGIGYKKTNIYFTKIDCLYTYEDEIFNKIGISNDVLLSKDFCPDHYLAVNFNKIVNNAITKKAKYIFLETAGLCARCSPYFNDFLSICVTDVSAGINSPAKMGPLLIGADIVAVTKNDLISQTESKLYFYEIKQVSNAQVIVAINGRTGEGIHILLQTIKHYFKNTQQKIKINLKEKNLQLRYPLPKLFCSYCFGKKSVQVV